MINGYCQLDLTDLFRGLGLDEVTDDSLNVTISEYGIDLYSRLEKALSSKKPVMIVFIKSETIFETLMSGVLAKNSINGYIEIAFAEVNDGAIDTIRMIVTPDNLINEYSHQTLIASN